MDVLQARVLPQNGYELSSEHSIEPWSTLWLETLPSPRLTRADIDLVSRPPAFPDGRQAVELTDGYVGGR